MVPPPVPEVGPRAMPRLLLSVKLAGGLQRAAVQDDVAGGGAARVGAEVVVGADAEVPPVTVVAPL